MSTYRLTFDSGMGLVTWRKTAEELLTPNGSSDTLLDFMLRESVARSSYITLEPCDSSGERVRPMDLAEICDDVIWGLVQIANRGGLSGMDMINLGVGTGVVAKLASQIRVADPPDWNPPPLDNDEPNVRFPECAECGAPPGQAHDPTCSGAAS